MLSTSMEQVALQLRIPKVTVLPAKVRPNVDVSSRIISERLHVQADRQTAAYYDIASVLAEYLRHALSFAFLQENVPLATMSSFNPLDYLSKLSANVSHRTLLSPCTPLHQNFGWDAMVHCGLCDIRDHFCGLLRVLLQGSFVWPLFWPLDTSAVYRSRSRFRWDHSP